MSDEKKNEEVIEETALKLCARLMLGEKGVFADKGAQGDAGNVSMLVVQPTLNVDISRELGIFVGASYYHRDRHYKHHDDVRSHTWEWTAGLSYNL